MFEHQKDTVNCVASGKEEHISATDVYEMSQTKNMQYRWKHAFRFPSVFSVLPNRSLYLGINSDEEGKFDTQIKADCAETAVKLKFYAKKYVTKFEENSTDKIGAEAPSRKKLREESASHSMNNISFDVSTSVPIAHYDQHCNQSHLSLAAHRADASV